MGHEAEAVRRCGDAVTRFDYIHDADAHILGAFFFMEHGSDLFIFVGCITSRLKRHGHAIICGRSLHGSLSMWYTWKSRSRLRFFLCKRPVCMRCGACLVKDEDQCKYQKATLITVLPVDHLCWNVQ